LFRLGVGLAVVAALVAGGYLYFRLDDEIRQQVENRLSNHYRGFRVQVGRARFDQDRGIAVYGVSLTPRDAGPTQEPILSIDEMYLSGPLRVEDLVTGQLPIEQILARRAKLHAIYAEDGTWNVSSLLPLPDLSKRSPTFTIEDATVVLQEGLTSPAKSWALRGVEMKLTPIENQAAGGTPSKRLMIDGTASGLPARELRVQGELGIADFDMNVTVSANGLEMARDLFAILPGVNTSQLAAADISGTADIVAHFCRPAGGGPPALSASFKLDRGQIAHPLLPSSLTEVTLTGHADRDRFVVERLNGKCGPATVVLALERAGWAATAPLAASASIAGLPLDDRLRAKLTASKARIWDRFRPAGVIDASIRVQFDGEEWRTNVSAECRGISLTDTKEFPYTLEQTTGRIEYQPANEKGHDRLTLNLTGVGGGQPVHIEADLSRLKHEPASEEMLGDSGVAAEQMKRPSYHRTTAYRGVHIRPEKASRTSHPVGFVEISGTDIPFHEQLLAALPEKGEKFVRELRPQGAIDFRFRADWKEFSQPLADKNLEIVLKDCSIRYAPFPYPLHHVHGVAAAHNWCWKLQNIEGRGGNDSTIVKCRGEASPTGDGCHAELVFEAFNVPLDDNLKLSLTSENQQAWDELQPDGRIDLTARVLHDPAHPKPDVEVTLRPRERSVSLQPRIFPYRLVQLDGVATANAGMVTLRNVVAAHDRTRFSATGGTFQRTPHNGWQFALNGVNVDRVTATGDLVAAMPPGLQMALERLHPTGAFDVLQSNISFTKESPAARVAARWDVNLECQQADIEGGIPLKSMTGGIRLVGQTDGTNTYTAGELALDSVICNDIQLTNVRGPLWVDSSTCLLGEPASARQGQSARRITADTYGGSMTANAEVRHDDNLTYKAEIHLGAADLARFANERLGGPNDMSGKVSGAVVIAGTGKSLESLRGGGELHVVDAHIYELPPLVQMLKVLRNRTPNSTAFNRCDMQFAIQGEQLHFKQLNLLGDAVSLYGNGRCGFNRKLDLVFYTLIGPADLPIPLWKTVAGHVSQQSWQLQVSGTFDHPEIERKALPAVNNMLEHIQNELEEGAATIAPTTAGRNSNQPPR
jgi:hypothetical protein